MIRLSKSKRKIEILKRIESLRQPKTEGLIPNLAHKVKARMLLDELENDKPIRIPKCKTKKLMQKSGLNIFSLISAIFTLCNS